MVREANLSDIPAMHTIRMAVKENKLNNPELVKEKDYEEYLTKRGKGWVFENDTTITGFAIVDLLENNIWALFIDPLHDQKGYGRQLHEIMMNWYFDQTGMTAWLSTAPGTRAEAFYRKAGWKEAGITKSGEIRFELAPEEWRQLKKES